MARMSVDDMLGRDTRLMRLAQLCGWTRRETAGALVLDVWPLCYDRRTTFLNDIDLDLAAGLTGFTEHMIAAGLAHRTPHGVRIAGAKQRIKYLEAKSRAGRKGGVASGDSRRTRRDSQGDRHEAKPKQPASTGQAAGNPSVNTPSPVPDPDPVNAPALVLERVSAAPTRLVTDHFQTRYRTAYGTNPSWNERTGKQVKHLLKSHTPDEINRRTDILFDSPPPFLTGPHDFSTLVQHFDKLVQPSRSEAQRRQSSSDGLAYAVAVGRGDVP